MEKYTILLRFTAYECEYVMETSKNLHRIHIRFYYGSMCTDHKVCDSFDEYNHLTPTRLPRWITMFTTHFLK